MLLYSTLDRHHRATFLEAVARGIPPGGGLYLPKKLAPLPGQLLTQDTPLPFPEIAYLIARSMLDGEIPDHELQAICEDAFAFPLPMRQLDNTLAALELFHGPTLAFKDFGARFLGRMLAYQRRGMKRETIVLVATSGDTGSAVASGCAGIDGIRVVLLYPEGKVSRIQELQLTAVAANVETVRVQGTFDDCQRMVKGAFADPTVTRALALTSANSINIARLLPQVFYYVAAWRQVNADDRGVIFAVPSGNLGNLTAGLMARAMGLPVKRFLAATNINDVLPEYLRTGVYRPRPAQSTLSNAMDVGDPNNISRITALFDENLESMRACIGAESRTDDDTRAAIANAFARYRYVFDPHGAVAYSVADRYRERHDPGAKFVVLATAHPAKFPEAYGGDLQHVIPLPDQLRGLADRPRQVLPMRARYEDLKALLMA